MLSEAGICKEWVSFGCRGASASARSAKNQAAEGTCAGGRATASCEDLAAKKGQAWRLWPRTLHIGQACVPWMSIMRSAHSAHKARCPQAMGRPTPRIGSQHVMHIGASAPPAFAMVYVRVGWLSTGTLAERSLQCQLL